MSILKQIEAKVEKASTDYSVETYGLYEEISAKDYRLGAMSLIPLIEFQIKEYLKTLNTLEEKQLIYNKNPIVRKYDQELLDLLNKDEK